jgi:DNA-binding MarR family transcriptional regulator
MHGDEDEDRRCQIYSLNPKSCMMMRTVISARRLVKEIIAVMQSHMYWLLFSLLPQLIE